MLESGVPDVPPVERKAALDDWLPQLRVLHGQCKGNLVRVREELLARHGVDVKYSTLTRFCRDAELGVVPKQAAGRYEFGPGEEMQHDTSPHRLELGGRAVTLQCASLILCF